MGIWKVGLVLLPYGCVDATTCLLSGHLVKYTGRIPIFITGLNTVLLPHNRTRNIPIISVCVHIVHGDVIRLGNGTRTLRLKIGVQKIFLLNSRYILYFHL